MTDAYDVRVTSYTVPSPEIADVFQLQPGPNDLLAFYARVSNEANQSNHATGRKLIRGLIRKKEWSPLEMVNVVMEIRTTRDIGRQILRHTALRPQEFSQRYAAVEDKPIFRECRFAHPTNRQSSVEVNPASDSEVRIAQAWLEDQQEVWDLAMAKYTKAIGMMGIAKEVARVVLPEGITPTRMYFNGSMRSWYHYTELRIQESTQKEHRLIAQKCWSLILELFPSIPDHQVTMPLIEGHPMRAPN